MDGTELVRGYYRAVDADDYDTLASLLAAEFVHYRPDRTIEGREEFVGFMRSKRPEPDTDHDLSAVYAAEDGRLAAEGRLLRPDGTEWFGFVDAFETGDRGIHAIRTYTDSH